MSGAGKYFIGIISEWAFEVKKVKVPQDIKPRFCCALGDYSPLI
jgi:hypothetical protein